MTAVRRTIVADVEQLQECGYDTVCNKGKQNKYLIGERDLEPAELKMLVDAVHAALFITLQKSKALLKAVRHGKPLSGAELSRELYIVGRVKTTNEGVFYAVDLLCSAINEQKQEHSNTTNITLQRKRCLRTKGKSIDCGHMIWFRATTAIMRADFRKATQGGKAPCRRMYKPALSDKQSVKITTYAAYAMGIQNRIVPYVKEKHFGLKLM